MTPVDLAPSAPGLAAEAAAVLGALARVDVGELADAAVADRVRELYGLRALIDAALVDALGVFDARKVFGYDGMFSTAAWVAGRVDVHRASVSATVKVAREVRSMPLTMERVRAGEVGLDKLRHLAAAHGVSEKTAADYEANEAEILATVAPFSVEQTGVFAALWAAASDPEADEARHRDREVERKVNLSRSLHGMAFLQGLLTTEGAAIVDGQIEAIIDDLHRWGLACDAAGTRLTAAQLRHDALVEMALRSGASSTTVEVRHDARERATARGHGAESSAAADRTGHSLHERTVSPAAPGEAARVGSEDGSARPGGAGRIPAGRPGSDGARRTGPAAAPRRAPSCAQNRPAPPAAVRPVSSHHDGDRDDLDSGRHRDAGAGRDRPPDGDRLLGAIDLSGGAGPPGAGSPPGRGRPPGTGSPASGDRLLGAGDPPDGDRPPGAGHAADHGCSHERAADALIRWPEDEGQGSGPPGDKVAAGLGRALFAVMVDVDTLDGRSAQGAFGRIAQIVGHGPVPDSTIRRLLCDAGISRVVTQGRSLPLDVGSVSRTATPAQWRALIAHAGGCEFPGCDCPWEWCEAHHLDEWTRTHRTDLAGLALECHGHHALLHRPGWSMTRRADGTMVVTRPDGTTLTGPRHRSPLGSRG